MEYHQQDGTGSLFLMSGRIHISSRTTFVVNMVLPRQHMHLPLKSCLMQQATGHRTCILKSNPRGPYNHSWVSERSRLALASTFLAKKVLINTLDGDYTPFITVKEMVKSVCLGFLSITSNSFSIMIDDWNC